MLETVDTLCLFDRLSWSNLNSCRRKYLILNIYYLVSVLTEVVQVASSDFCTSCEKEKAHTKSFTFLMDLSAIRIMHISRYITEFEKFELKDISAILF